MTFLRLLSTKARVCLLALNERSHAVMVRYFRHKARPGRPTFQCCHSRRVSSLSKKRRDRVRYDWGIIKLWNNNFKIKLQPTFRSRRRNSFRFGMLQQERATVASLPPIDGLVVALLLTLCNSLLLTLGTCLT